VIDNIKTNDVELKLCPFCGDSPIRYEIIIPFTNDEFGWQIMCEGCGCVLIRETEIEAIADWNRRAKVEKQIRVKR